MEQKPPAGTVPALGRLKLKRVAVPVGKAPDKKKQKRVEAAPEVAEVAPVIRRTAMVVAHNDNVRKAVMALLPKERFDVTGVENGDQGYEHYTQNGVELAIIGRDLPGMSGTVLSQLIRKSRKGTAVAIVLMSTRYTDPYLGSRDCSAFGADAPLALPAAPEKLYERVELALSMREPVERLDVLPKPVAQRVDTLFENYETLSYYELLEVRDDADRASIQRAFHERSLSLHPDRHARLRNRHPHAWERINTVYKRISEAYKVLTDESRRRSYNLGLRKRGALRAASDGSGRQGREQRELRMCQTEGARREVLESLELRSLGDLEGAGEAMERAALLEPHNEDLRLLLTSIRKLEAIVNRRT